MCPACSALHVTQAARGGQESLIGSITGADPTLRGRRDRACRQAARPYVTMAPTAQPVAAMVPNACGMPVRLASFRPEGKTEVWTYSRRATRLRVWRKVSHCPGPQGCWTNTQRMHDRHITSSEQPPNLSRNCRSRTTLGLGNQTELSRGTMGCSPCTHREELLRGGRPAGDDARLATGDISRHAAST